MNSAIAAATSEEALVTGVPGDARHLFFVPTESLQFRPHEAKVKELDKMVPRCCKEPITVHVPCHVCAGVLVCVPITRHRDVSVSKNLN